jgi:hypothetical protein
VAAEALADQVALLEELSGERSGTAAALTDPPAWARHRDEPRPVSHDSIFDFTRTPAGFSWFDNLAAAAQAARDPRA